jgi:hypothetical protein
MIEALEKIQAILKETKTLALFSKKYSDDYKLLAKAALKHALENKKIKVLSLPDNPEFKKRWGAVLPSEIEERPFLKQTSIRIPKNQYKVRELTYEDNDDFLSLIITSENSGLQKNEIAFEPIPPKAEAAFCFFEPSETDTLQEFENQLVLPPQEKIIFLTAGTDITFSEKISRIIKTIAPDSFSSPQISTLLFASLITETDNFLRPVSQEVLRFGSELLSLAADKEKIRAILNQNKTISLARLLGRALARTHVDEALDVSWTFLSQKDLEKTENLNPSASFLYEIVRQLRELVPFRALSLLFWQNDRNIFALAATNEEKNLLPLASRLDNAKLQSRYLSAGPFNNFSEAELLFRKILKGADILKT